MPKHVSVCVASKPVEIMLKSFSFFCIRTSFRIFFRNNDKFIVTTFLLSAKKRPFFSFQKKSFSQGPRHSWQKILEVCKRYFKFAIYYISPWLELCYNVLILYCFDHIGPYCKISYKTIMGSNFLGSRPVKIVNNPAMGKKT